MKKLWSLITSLKLAIFLLVIIAVYSIIGTVLPQGLASEFYLENYSTFGRVITVLQFDDIYHSWIYVSLLTLFVINLAGCTFKILPGQVRRFDKDYYPSVRKDSENLYNDEVEIKSLVDKLKRKRYKVFRDGNGYMMSKNRIGYLGSSITHLGIVIILVGSFFGGLFAFSGFFNLLPGDVRAFNDHGFAVRLDDFYMEFRDNKSIEQYYSEVTVVKPSGDERQETMWVNKPMKVNGIDFYQTSYGWASRLVIKNKDGEILDMKYLRNNESHFFQSEHLTILLYGYYPDMVVTSAGEPLSMSEKEDNPHYAVVLYHFNDHAGSYITEPGQTIEYGDYLIEFEESRLYTGITFRRDFGYVFVVIGSFIMLLGLLVSFYLYPKFIVIKEQEIYTITRQNSWGFNYQIKRMIEDSIKREDK